MGRNKDHSNCGTGKKIFTVCTNTIKYFVNLVQTVKHMPIFNRNDVIYLAVKVEIQIPQKYIFYTMNLALVEISWNSILRESRDHFVYVPSQRDMALYCNAVSHWLGPYTEWSLWKHARLSLKHFNVYIPSSTEATVHIFSTFGHIHLCDIHVFKHNCCVRFFFSRYLAIRNNNVCLALAACGSATTINKQFTMTSQVCTGIFLPLGLFQGRPSLFGPRYWAFVWGIHRWPVNSPHKGQ